MACGSRRCARQLPQPRCRVVLKGVETCQPCRKQPTNASPRISILISRCILVHFTADCCIVLNAQKRINTGQAARSIILRHVESIEHVSARYDSSTSSPNVATSSISQPFRIGRFRPDHIACIARAPKDPTSTELSPRSPTKELRISHPSVQYFKHQRLALCGIDSCSRQSLLSSLTQSLESTRSTIDWAGRLALEMPSSSIEHSQTTQHSLM